MRRKRTSRTVELTVERSEFFVASRSRQPNLFQCAHCGGPAPFATALEAARISGKSLREVFRRIESAEIHFFEMPDGALLVCLNSLNQNS